MEGLFYGGKVAFQNQFRASLIVGRKIAVFALFYFVFEGNFPSTILEERFNRGFFCISGLGSLYLEGHIHGGAYFSEFYGILN